MYVLDVEMYRDALYYKAMLRTGDLLCNLGLNHMCGIVVSVAMKEAGKARTSTREENDGWESLVMLNTPRGAPRFTFVPDPPFFAVSENTD